MEEKIETRIPPAIVWEAWEKAHRLHSSEELAPGLKTRSKEHKFRYQILDVIPGKSFSILWKTLFVRLIFTHTVTPIHKGSEICYQVQIKGLFAWPVRWLLGNKIRHNIALVLKQIVRQLEDRI